MRTQKGRGWGLIASLSFVALSLQYSFLLCSLILSFKSSCLFSFNIPSSHLVPILLLKLFQLLRYSFTLSFGPSSNKRFSHFLPTFQIQDRGDAHFPADERQSTDPLPRSFYPAFPVTTVPLLFPFLPLPWGAGTRI